MLGSKRRSPVPATRHTCCVTPLEQAEEHDAAGREVEAIPLYRLALEDPLPDARRVQVLIQLGSSLRNVGRLPEALAALAGAAELAPGSVGLAAFRALALTDAGEGRLAVSELMAVLLAHVDDPLLLRYRRALTEYAADLAQPIGTTRR